MILSSELASIPKGCHVNIIDHINTNNYALSSYLNFLNKSDYNSIFKMIKFESDGIYTNTQLIEATAVSYYLSLPSYPKKNILKSLLKAVNNTDITTKMLQYGIPINNNSINWLYFPITIHTLLTYGTLVPTNKTLVFRQDYDINDISTFNNLFMAS